jgi:hypothetical protein
MQSLTRLIIAFVACSVLALTTFAGPEAIPQRDSKDKEVVAPAPSCDYSWTGFYIGVNVGYGWGEPLRILSRCPVLRRLSILIRPHASPIRPESSVVDSSVIISSWENSFLVLRQIFKGQTWREQKRLVPSFNS